MGMTPDPVDIEIGARIAERRKALRLTQQELAQSCGVTFQQVQKYERGANRVSSSRLYRIAAVLDAEPADFFPGAEARDAMGKTKRGAELARLFVRLDEPRQDSLVNVARAIASTIAGDARLQAAR